MQGGMLVAGLVTGGHYIEDIQIMVPHKVAVLVPAEKVLRSKDLYRALGQNLLFKLDGGGFSAETAVPMADSNADLVRIASLEAELRSVKVQNDVLTQQNTALTQLLTGLQQQMDALTQGIHRLETKPSVGSTMAFSPRPSVVEGDAPIFIPDTSTLLKDADTQINVTTQVSEASPVGAAGNKLREMRKKSGNG